MSEISPLLSNVPAITTSAVRNDGTATMKGDSLLRIVKSGQNCHGNYMFRIALTAVSVLLLLLLLLHYHHVSPRKYVSVRTVAAAAARHALDLSVLRELASEGQVAEEVDQVLKQTMEEEDKWHTKEKVVANDGNDDSNPPKYILYWNEAYGGTDYGFCCGREPFEKYECPVRNCFATDNRSLFNGTTDKFDAIVFHQRSMDKEDLPATRTMHQRYIMFMLESASYPMSFESGDWGGYFNWTLTYRRDSDFPLLYGHIEQTRAHPPRETEKLGKLVKDFGRANRNRMAAGKTKLAAWFVSNCETQSLREKYVEALQQQHHLQVDVYGGCGTMSCQREREEDCWEMVERDYKFYLSFENSLCKDYVTEKFFNAAKRRVVPVTLGGANYSAIAPFHSSINVYHELDDPGELARLLRDLDADDAKYAEYFWWKDYYEVLMGPEDRAKAFCDICKRLNEEDDSSSSSVYEDLEEWWVRKSKCRHHRMKS